MSVLRTTMRGSLISMGCPFVKLNGVRAINVEKRAARPVFRPPVLIVERAAFPHRPGVQSAGRPRMSARLPVYGLKRPGAGRWVFSLHAATLGRVRSFFHSNPQEALPS